MWGGGGGGGGRGGRERERGGGGGGGGGRGEAVESIYILECSTYCHDQLNVSHYVIVHCSDSE